MLPSALSYKTFWLIVDTLLVLIRSSMKAVECDAACHVEAKAEVCTTKSFRKFLKIKCLICSAHYIYTARQPVLLSVALALRCMSCGHS